MAANILEVDSPRTQRSRTKFERQHVFRAGVNFFCGILVVGRVLYPSYLPPVPPSVRRRRLQGDWRSRRQGEDKPRAYAHLPGIERNPVFAYVVAPASGVP